jgi:CRISPR-associated protein Cmr3
MERLFFEPQDTLFFRDGQPFNQGEGNAGVESLFPPSPLTMVGAARVAWARARGWAGKGRWIDAIGSDLGGDESELVGLNFSGPLLELNGEPVFPAPASLIGIDDSKDCPQKTILLHPGPPMHCDLGDSVRLPVPDVNDDIKGRKLLDGWYLIKTGLEKVLKGESPDRTDWVKQSSLWVNEPKVGNQISSETGTTEQGMLYSTRHIRLQDGVKLVMGIEGDLEGFPDETQIPLGGEARSGWISQKPDGLSLPSPQLAADGENLRYAVHVLTPLNPNPPPEPEQKEFEGLPGKVISACLPRVQRWGGWDSTSFQPDPMKPHLAPGSVIFIEAKASEIQNIQKYHGKNIGQRKSWGFGLITIGQWN